MVTSTNKNTSNCNDKISLERNCFKIVSLNFIYYTSLCKLITWLRIGLSRAIQSRFFFWYTCNIISHTRIHMVKVSLLFFFSELYSKLEWLKYTAIKKRKKNEIRYQKPQFTCKESSHDFSCRKLAYVNYWYESSEHICHKTLHWNRIITMFDTIVSWLVLLEVIRAVKHRHQDCQLLKKTNIQWL